MNADKYPELSIWDDGIEYWLSYSHRQKHQKLSGVRAGLSLAWNEIDRTGRGGFIHVYDQAGEKIQTIDARHLNSRSEPCSHPSDEQTYSYDYRDMICKECGWVRELQKTTS